MVSVDVSEWNTLGISLMNFGLCFVLVAGVGLYTLGTAEMSGIGDVIFTLLFVSAGLLGIGVVTAGALTVYRDNIRPGVALVAATIAFVVLPWVTNTNWTVTGLGSLGTFVGVWTLLYWKDIRK